MRRIFVPLGLLIIFAGLIYAATRYEHVNAPTTEAIMSFADCEAAGYPVMESYPRQCSTPGGRLFAEEIIPLPQYVNASADDVRIALPYPGAVTGKSFTVTGEARGPWYFEASFPVEVRDTQGGVLATGVAKAQGEWMTPEFVSFSAPITVPETYIGPATLILKKDNPSGDPERDASVIVPFTIEY